MSKKSKGLWILLPFSLREISEAPYRREARIEIEKFLNNLGDKRISVLDAGAGNGFAKNFFKNHDYTAIDIKKSDASAPHILGDVQSMPFPNASFDLVISLEVLEYIPEPQKAISEFFRVLKKDGVLILSTPLMVGFHNDFRRFTPPLLKNMLQSAGFDVKKVISIGGYYRTLGWFISRFSGRVRKPKSKVFWPFYYLVKIPVGFIFQILVPICFFLIDGLDKEKRETCGYVTLGVKE